MRNLDRADEARRTILEEHSAAFRWLMASLLAINAGGLLALDDAKTQSPYLLISGGLFLIGVLASLLIGVFSQRANQAVIVHLANVTNFWIEAYEKDEFDSESHQNLMDAGTAVLRRARSSRVAGWASAISFASAIILMGVDRYEQQLRPAEQTTPSIGKRNADENSNQVVGN
jgi:hypothetical protein